MASDSYVVDSDDDGVEFANRSSQSGLCVITHGQGAQPQVPLFALAQPVHPFPLLYDNTPTPPQDNDSEAGGHDLPFDQDAEKVAPQASVPEASNQTVKSDKADAPKSKQGDGKVSLSKPELVVNLEDSTESAGSPAGAPGLPGSEGGKSEHESESIRKRKAAVLDPRALEMQNDPKFKKGTRLSSLSPDSKKVMNDIRKLRARENSTSWHTRFESKGIPKELNKPPEEDSRLSGPAAEPGDAVPEPSITTGCRPSLKDARVSGLHLMLQ